MKATGVAGYVAAMAAMAGRDRPEGWHSDSPAAFLAEHGRSWRYTPGPLPEGVTWGRRGECFRNAAMTLLEGGEARGWRYCEGYAHPGTGVPVWHAWLVTPAGEVIDPTWRPSLGTEREYFGVAFSAEWLWKTVRRTRRWGVLFDGSYPAMESRPAEMVA